MKKQLSILALGCLVSSAAMAQNGFQPCNTYAAMEQRFQQDPSARQRYEAAQLQLEKEVQAINQNAMAKSMAFEYTVPVVFHILHLGGSENISDQLVYDALAQINRDYARAGSDVSTIAQPFQNLYIDSDIRFVLAKKDPNGNQFSGIEHLYDARTEWKQGDLSYYNNLSWNPTKYLNIIIVKNIIPTSPISGGQVGGYTYKPGTWSTGATSDAIVYRFSMLNGLGARALSHEIGHWLNLDHTFGNTNNPGVSCGDDNVADTPPTKGNYSQCPSSLSGNTCASSSTSYYAAGQENVENIMDYSTCAKNFTAGQTARMRAALASSVSNRQNLWQPANLAATGSNEVDFWSSNNSYTVCAGGSLTFQDRTSIRSTSFSWAADNGATITSPADSMTAINFPMAGITTVSLTNGVGTGTRSVYVQDPTATVTGPFLESFEGDDLPYNWTSTNYNPGSAAWEHTWDSFYDGLGCFMLIGANAGSYQMDELISAPYDLSSVPDAQMTFALGYAQKNAQQNDLLKVQASIDCGGTWLDLVLLGGNQMQSGSGGVTATSFTPVGTDQWKIIDVTNSPNWNNVKTSSSVRFKFTFIEDDAGGGNNIFIDAVNVFAKPVGVAENVLAHGMKLYPNPTGGAATLMLSLSSASDVAVSVYNVIGKEVLRVPATRFDAGEREIVLNHDSQLPSGIYVVTANVNGVNLSSKLVVR